MRVWKKTNLNDELYGFTFTFLGNNKNIVVRINSIGFIHSKVRMGMGGRWVNLEVSLGGGARTAFGGEHVDLINS